MSGRRKSLPNPSLFERGEHVDQGAPLATRMRPQSLAKFAGQAHLVGDGKPLRLAIESGQPPSCIFWGPPGSGKTTLARIIAGESSAHFAQLSAVSSGVADLRGAIAEAQTRSRDTGLRTILFIDEIHRFNKAQQDALLPYVEDGTVTLIGATTENPSFEVISPLLSRARVFTLQVLEASEVRGLLESALSDSVRGLGAVDSSAKSMRVDDEALDAVVGLANGDARVALNTLELAVRHAAASESESLDVAIVEAVAERRLRYDKGGDSHYDTISAFIKSLRGSDPDAALYWLARMLEAGEDPMFIVRRMVILAAEDVGLADPQALSVTVAAQQAVHFVGLPEGYLPMAEAALYLALAPKSNSALNGYTRARDDVRTHGDLPVPLHLRNSVTGLMASLGYGAGYQYAHNQPDHRSPEQVHLPEELTGRRYYEPGLKGQEPEIARGITKSGASDTGPDNEPRRPAPPSPRDV